MGIGLRCCASQLGFDNLQLAGVPVVSTSHYALLC